MTRRWNSQPGGIAALSLLTLLPFAGANTAQAQTGQAPPTAGSDNSTRDRVAQGNTPLPIPVVLKMKSGDTALRRGDMQEAALTYAQAALLAPSNPLPRLATGVTLAAIGRVSDAVPQLRKAVSLADNDVVAALLLSEALTEIGKGEEAQDLYQDTVRRFSRAGKPSIDASASVERLLAANRQFPESPVYLLLLGDAYQISEQWISADDAYKKAIALAPLWVKPRVNLGISRLAQGKSDEAMRTFESALALEPGNVQVQLLKGDAQISAGQNDAAVVTFSNIAKQNGKGIKNGVAAQAMVGMGQALVNTRSYGKALQSLSVAQKLDPKDPVPNALIGEIQVQNGNFDAAVVAYQSALQLSRGGGLFSNQAVLYRALAEAQLSARKPDNALNTLKRALADAPGEAALWHRFMAQAYYAKNDTSQAEQSLHAALENDSSLYPQDTLNAIAGHGLIEKFRQSYLEVNEAAETGIHRQANSDGGITLTNKVKAVTPQEQARTLEILAHIARYLNETREEIRLREEVTRLRGTGRDWFLLGEAFDLRASEPGNARAAYGKAFEVGGVPPAVADWARNRLKALTAPLYKP
jgi:tetratricopeptide (TPR) repeat protein